MLARNLFVLLIVAMVASVALAIPNEIQYQGKLTDADGIGMNGDFEMSFRIFDAPTAGTLLWTELHHAPGDEVPVDKGLFDVLLGSITPIDLDFSVDYWLEITVDGNILLPRVKLSSSPYAYRAAIADSVVGGSAVGDTALWQVHTTDPLIFPKNNANVLFYDDGEKMTIYAENALSSGTGTSVIYGYANGSSSDPTTWDISDMNSALKGYVAYGENFSASVAGFYDGWGVPSAAVLGSYFSGTDELGALGYYDGSNYIGVYGQQGEWGDYAGWFDGNFHLEPQPEPLFPLLGDIYADDVTDKAYFFNGTDWVDMTATPGAGSSQWTDHAVDPYIFANNNENVQVWDDGEVIGLIVNAFGTSAGTAVRGLGDYGPADTCLGYLGFGGNLTAHPDAWGGAGVYGYTEYYVDAIYGYAADGGYGVFGVADGMDDYAGVRGYHNNTGTDGRLGTQEFGGEFDPGILLIPGTAPTAVKGALYADASDNNLYFHDGTSWVDLTAGGSGGGEWEDAGDYKRVIGNDNVRAYEVGHSHGLYAEVPSTTSGTHHALFAIVTGDDASIAYGLKSYSGVYGGGGMGGDFYGVYSEAEWGDNSYGVYGVSNSAIDNSYGVYGFGRNTSGNPADVYGVYGLATSDNGTKYGVYGTASGTGTNWAGYFDGDIRVTGRYFDSSGDAGTAGQILSSTATGTNWIAAPGGGFTWGTSSSGTGLWGFTLRNTTPSTDSVFIAGNGSSGIKVIHYNSFGTRAIEAYEGPSTTNYYSYGALGTYADYTGTRGNIVNAGVYGELPNNGGGGAAVLGIDNNTLALEANHYAGYFVGKVKVDGSIDAGQNPFCITLTAGENIALGDIVAVSTTADLTVIKALTGSETVIGVATEAASSAAPVRIAIGGAVQVQTSAAVTRANFVRVGGTAGQAIDNGTSGVSGDFGIFLQTTADAGLAWMVFKQAEIY